MKINFNNCYSVAYRKHIRKIFNYAMDKLNIKEKYSVNITFVDEEEIRELNNLYREVDKVTDVLSFPLMDYKDAEMFKEKYVDLGDIVICKTVAKLQAKEYGHSYIREVCFLSLHGLLHLLGYDHIEEEDEKVMTELQASILEDLGIKR